MSTPKKTSEIRFKIELDVNNVPERIEWTATDGASGDECKAFILSVWDGNAANTLRIDLWNKDMQVDEMKYFVHQTILTLADTFEKATGEDKMAMTMRDFCEYFAEKMALKRE
jgi:gliding motility-associated protein GldC